MSKLFVLSGPSGSGKSTLIDMLIEKYKSLFSFSISTTTRSIRDGEVNGINYYFLTKQEFEEKIENNELVEYQQIYGNYYGTTKDEIRRILDNNLNVLMDIDVYGKINFDKAYPDNIGILVIPPSIDILKNRLVKRNREPLEDIIKRLNIVKDEIDFATSKGKYEYKLVNKILDESFNELEQIILEELQV